MQPNKGGFTLLESLVALVVLAMVFSGVWGWFGTAATSTTNIERALALPGVFEQYLDYMALEPLQQQRSGETDIGSYRLQWQATENRRSEREFYRRQPAWIVTLFDVEVHISQEGQPVSQVSTQLVRQWRDPNFLPPPERFK